mgnify:CR=1 FL=1
MVYKVGVQSQNVNNRLSTPAFFGEKKDKKSKCENHDYVMAEEKAKRPISTSLKITADKFMFSFCHYNT